jgi:hypothetical protein
LEAITSCNEEIFLLNAKAIDHATLHTASNRAEDLNQQKLYESHKEDKNKLLAHYNTKASTILLSLTKTYTNLQENVNVFNKQQAEMSQQLVDASFKLQEKHVPLTHLENLK